VQGRDEHGAGETDEHAEDGQDQHDAQERREERRLARTGNREPLGPVDREWLRPGPGLGGEHQANGRDDHGREQQGVRHGQRVGDVLGEQAGDQGAETEAAEGGDGRHELGPVRQVGGPVGSVQLVQVGGRGRRGNSDRQAADDPGDKQSRQRRPRHEDDRAGSVQAHGRQQQRPAAVDVRQMPGEEEADGHPHGVDGIDQRDHQRREPVPAGIEGIQRAGDGGERGQGQEAERRGPVAETVPAGPALRGDHGPRVRCHRSRLPTLVTSGQ
jgi:hypothetical protein